MELTATVRRASLRKVNVVHVKKATTPVLMAQHVKVSYVQATFPCIKEIPQNFYRASKHAYSTENIILGVVCTVG